VAERTVVADALRERYALERELGQGGMATVYLAEDLKYHRRVALKVLRARAPRAPGADRFLAEIRVSAKLQHPHICRCSTPGWRPRSCTT
jgi:eukaryotic-like serine/threonine-protein kinase